jgi:hypothetical protein
LAITKSRDGNGFEAGTIALLASDRRDAVQQSRPAFARTTLLMAGDVAKTAVVSAAPRYSKLRSNTSAAADC